MLRELNVRGAVADAGSGAGDVEDGSSLGGGGDEGREEECRRKEAAGILGRRDVDFPRCRRGVLEILGRRAVEVRRGRKREVMVVKKVVF